MLMTHRPFPLARRLMLASLALAMLSPWARPVMATTVDEVLSAQILDGWAIKDKGRMAAMKLSLAPGWKTYWRSPGEAGIPPQFDWSGSENLRAVVLHWPRPTVFETNGMKTIGYHDQLMLPIELIAKDPNQPIRLRAEVELGVCEDVCIPAAVSLAADLPSGAAQSANAPAIKAALKLRPETAKEAKLSKLHCEITPIKDGLKLVANIDMPAGSQAAETVAIETNNPAIWIAEVSSQRSGNRLVAETDLVPPEGRPFALDRSELRLTILSPGRAVEINGCPGG